MSNFSAGELEAQIRGYMDACTSGMADAVARFLADDAVHYFPPDMYDGPWKGGRYIADRWAKLVAEGRSAWTVDAVAIDVDRQTAACEWTHFKQTAGVVLRGTEWYEFDEEARITEIRAYYASPQRSGLPRLELGGFDYAGRGYPLRAG
jgi:hypothetical protein